MSEIIVPPSEIRSPGGTGDMEVVSAFLKLDDVEDVASNPSNGPLRYDQDTFDQPYSQSLSRSLTGFMEPLTRATGRMSIANNRSRIPSYRPLEVSLPGVCDLICKSQSLQRGQIVVVERYAVFSTFSVTHRYLLMHIKREGKDDAWLRLDRRKDPRKSNSGFMLGSARSAAYDRASFSKSKEELIEFQTGRRVLESTLGFQRTPTLKHLVKYFDIMIKEMTQYKLWPENCWAFCSLIQQLLQQNFDGTFSEGSLNHPDIADSLRNRVLLEASMQSEISRISAHFGNVLSVAFSPDGTWIASASNDLMVRIWSMPSGQEIRKLAGIAGALNSMAISFDGSKIAAGVRGNAIIWSVETGKQLFKLLEDESIVGCVSFSPDSRNLVCGLSDKSLRMWSVETGEAVSRLDGHTGSVWCVSFSPDGQKIASGSSDESVRVWSVETGCELMCIRGHSAIVVSVAFSPDGFRIVSGSHDTTLRIWCADTGNVLQAIKGHSNRVHAAVFSPDGTYIASGSADKSIRLWSASTGALLRQFGGHESDVRSVAFHPDGTQLVSGSSDKTIRLWSTSAES